MTTRRSNIVVGVFNNERDARNVVDELKQAGFKTDQIGFAWKEGGLRTTNVRDDFVKLGVSQEEADTYQRELDAGRILVSVRADGQESSIRELFSRAGASTGNWSESAATSGYDATMTAGYNAAAGTTAGYNADLTNETDEQRSLRLRAERLEATKERVQAGEVRLHKDVVEEEQRINVPVTHEEVYIERHAVTGEQASDTPIGQDETIRVPVSEEQVQIKKTPYVTGEVEIGKRAVEETKNVTDTVRREEARVEREGNASVRDTTIDSDR